MEFALSLYRQQMPSHFSLVRRPSDDQKGVLTMPTRTFFFRFSVPLAVAMIGLFPGVGFSQHHGDGGGGHAVGGHHFSGGVHSGSGGLHSSSGGFHFGSPGFHGNYGGGGYHSPGTIHGGYHGGYYERDNLYHGYPYYQHHGGFYPGHYDSIYPGFGIDLNSYPGYYRYYEGDPYLDGSFYYYSPSIVDPSDYDEAPAETESDNRAYVTIRVPTMDAQIWIEDEKTSETGTIREYRSPPLEQGHHYTYEIKALWKEDGQVYKQTRKFPVNPGNRILVEFAKNISDKTGPRSSVQANMPNAP